jgi:glycosyltransferase involved in cell wall biosynthesis
VCCGSLYPNKFVDQLIEASDTLHAVDAHVRLLVIGGGPGLEGARTLAGCRPWVRCVGPKFGHEKAVLLSLAELWLNPGLVGLGVLDAFCAGLPIITRKLNLHSPEFDYVQHDVNGLVLPEDMEDYMHAVSALLRDSAQLARLRSGAWESAELYSIETMIDNFATGVKACLRSPS